MTKLKCLSSNMLGSEGFLTLTIKMRVRPEPECEEELVDLLKRYRDALNHSVEKISRGERPRRYLRLTLSSTRSSRRLSTCPPG
jgi:hypothetical protein